MKQKTVEWQMMMELVVGAFLFAIFVGLFWFTIVLSRQNLFVKKYPVQVRFDKIMGLQEGDNIVVRGMPVGKVTDLQLGRTMEDGVTVVGELSSPLQLHANYRAIIVTTSILGGRYLEIREGTSGSPSLDDTVNLKGELPVDLMEEASILVHDLKQSLNEGGVLKNLEATMVEIRGITTKLNQGEGTLGKLITDKAVYEDLTSITKDLREASAQVNQLISSVNRGEGTIGKLLKEDAVYNDLTRLSSNLVSVSQRLNDGKGTLGKLLSEDDQLYKDLSATAASLKNITAKVENGEGLLGRLVTDDSLYTDAQSAIKEFRAAIDDFRETSPITSFTTILFGAF
jgi:phospholipid/cholesterol/gamma-HCH transport system substrate-binding protein